ncbi:thiopeptide-type bacteriocin biosynthesis protein [Streptomyces coeruleoprunus]|uniref:Thiopeptide-type bacteriocin biosynthesis protein n=1 Tax=Streptomyces coeruleoprunus TaxID=285563 RepID=A0ABV9XJW6_9ACTN
MLEVERLLADCLHDARTERLGSVPLVPEGAAYAAARRAFLAAGLRALRGDRPETGWVQLNVAPGGAEAWPALYQRLDDTARDLMGSGAAQDFFFMHKPPGLRVRFRAPDAALAGALREELVRRLAPAPDGAWAAPWPAVYEPETYLFGGARSMVSVHRLFTVDSLAWLDHHTATGPTPDWRVSLSLLHAVLDGLGIVGWEHRGVWQAVREETGRRLIGGLRGAERERAAAGVRAFWELPEGARLDAAVPESRRAGLAVRQAALRDAARRWRADYFETGEAVLGPRRAAAHYVIFHWNRGRFSAARQSLLTEALAADTGRP